MGINFSVVLVAIGLKQGIFRLDIRETFFKDEGDEALEPVAQRGRRCPVPGNI